MTELKTTAARMVAEARARIEEIDTADLIARADDPDLVIVDIRDIRERKQGFIPGSVHAPRGMLEFWIDPESPYFREVFGQDKTYILHCAAGWPPRRSMTWALPAPICATGSRIGRRRAAPSSGPRVNASPSSPSALP